MHVQRITDGLAGSTPARFARRCEEVAPQLSRLPGLLDKVWLGAASADAGADSFGGVFLRRDRAALDLNTTGHVMWHADCPVARG
jgi:hypothetical protein